jgi:hypothetical protein
MFSLQTPVTHPIKARNKDTTINNRSCNIDGSNMYGLWVVKCVRKNLIIRDGDMGNLPSVPSSVTTN